MVIVTYLMSVLLYFAIVLLDIVFVFLVVRCLVRRWPTMWLRAFDTAGSQVVEGTLSIVDCCLAQRRSRAVRPDAKLIVCLIGLTFVRLALWSLFRTAQS